MWRRDWQAASAEDAEVCAGHRGDLAEHRAPGRDYHSSAALEKGGISRYSSTIYRDFLYLLIKVYRSKAYNSISHRLHTALSALIFRIV